LKEFLFRSSRYLFAHFYRRMATRRIIMSGIKDYSTTPASNIGLFPENQTPSSVNDAARQFQADTRSWYEDAEWTDLGHTPTRTGNTTFTLSGDKTTTYTTARRIKCTDSSTIYGTIASSSYSAPNTTVTIHSDSGNLSASLTAVALSTQKPTNTSLHSNLGRKGSDIASASSVDLSVATGDFVDVTGTTTITAFAAMAAGVVREIRFTGILTLTYNATSLILPGAANIATANGDIARFRSLGSGNWVCASYTRTSGTPTVGGGLTTLTATVFIASGTYTKANNLAFAVIEVLGSGAGGGGSGGAVTDNSGASGGGAGGYARRSFSPAQIGTTNTVTIGAAGTAGTSGTNNGGNGNTSSVALTGSGTITISASGGVHGAGGPNSTNAVSGGAPGVGSNGDINAYGGIGQNGWAISTKLSVGGNGGDSMYGGGGLGNCGAGAGVAGGAGTGYGSGGGGGAGTTNQAGGAGAPGLVVVWEYISA
jgi:hypothetical protein